MNTLNIPDFIRDLLNHGFEIQLMNAVTADLPPAYGFKVPGFYKNGHVTIPSKPLPSGQYEVYGRYGLLSSTVDNFDDLCQINATEFANYHGKGYEVDPLWKKHLVERGLVVVKEVVTPR
jgi:hypothetical protein